MTAEPSESSSFLPTQPAGVWKLRSSPPSIGFKRSSSAMESNMDVKTEPASGVREERSPIRTSSADTERPPSAQRVNPDTAVAVTEPSSEEETEDESDPADEIVDFDWTGLATRYHDAIKACEENETQLMEEWESLMNFFRVWAESGHSHETDRTYKRLRTRMSHVQKSEDNLEKKQLHYINVVQAFESALKLLGA